MNNSFSFKVDAFWKKLDVQESKQKLFVKMAENYQGTSTCTAKSL